MPDNADFYDRLPVFEGFANIMDPARYRPLPNDWLLGLTDVVDSTKAIAAGRYKSVNTAGASVISALSNALPDRKFPFVFGGDGASFAVPARDRSVASAVLADTAAWTRDDLDLTLRAALVPVAAVEAEGLTASVARFGPSKNVSYAMFSGGGLAWAERAMKAGRFTLPAAGAGARPDLTGLSCRWNDIPATRGVIVSLLVVPVTLGDPAFRDTLVSLLRDLEASGEVARTVPSGGLIAGWPPAGAELEARASRRRGESLFLGRIRVLFWTLISSAIFRTGMRVGKFDPAVYRRQVVENSDFRKYDDNLRMTLDCTPALADRIEQRLAKAQRDNIVRFGIHRQPAAIMTCIVPSATESNHVHFIDGAAGGYALAAQRLRAQA
ncbi:MAG TPA: DUF3095 domain-containing protein [Casimicrobiaceae bacterium]|nr:DUF3095 domain-containing protein [Casimicrobiaceae bacterium]